MAMTCPSSGVILTRRNAQWERGIARCLEMRVDDKRVVGPRQPAIAYPTGGTGADSVARASIGLIIDALRAHGLIDP